MHPLVARVARHDEERSARERDFSHPAVEVLTRTVNGTGHTGPSEFCAMDIFMAYSQCCNACAGLCEQKV